MTSTHSALPHVRVGVASPALAEAVARLVNEVYRATEGALWPSGVQRTDPDRALAGLARGDVLVALDDEADPTSLLGTVCTTSDEDGGAEFGMLAVAPHAGGRGLGERLVRAAEEHARAAGASRMEIIVIRPASGTLPAKERLAAWYPRLGYALTASAPASTPALPTAHLLRVPCLLDTYVRDLTRPTSQEHA